MFRASVAILPLILACGATPSGDDASTDASTTSDATDATVDGQQSADAAEDLWTPCGELPDPKVHYNQMWTCCAGKLCPGTCDPEIGCICGSSIGGCGSDELCCYDNKHTNLYCSDAGCPP